MIDKDKLKQLVEFAREQGLDAFTTTDGIRFEVPKLAEPEPVDDGKTTVQPVTPYDNLTDEQVQFWSSDYYDELQREKERRDKEKEAEEN